MLYICAGAMCIYIYISIYIIIYLYMMSIYNIYIYTYIYIILIQSDLFSWCSISQLPGPWPPGCQTEAIGSAMEIACVGDWLQWGNLILSQAFKGPTNKKLKQFLGRANSSGAGGCMFLIKPRGLLGWLSHGLVVP